MVQPYVAPFDVVEYLVGSRFPVGGLLSAKLSLPHGQVLWQERQNAEAFRAELRVCSPERLQQLLVQEWNEKPAADFGHYAKLSYWSLDEALALSFGKEPSSVSWNAVQPFVGRLAHASDFAKRREIIQRAKQMGQLWDQTIPSVFIAWTNRMAFPMPEELVAEIKRLGIQIRDWKSVHDEKASELAEATSEIERLRQKSIADQVEHMASLKEVTEGWKGVLKTKEDLVEIMQGRIDKLISRNDDLGKQATEPAKSEPSTRERQSLLKLALGMAMKKYRYDPAATRNAAVTNIGNDLREAGIPLDEDTIRKYLNEGKELLP